MHPSRDFDLAEKVAALSLPATYPDSPDSVRSIETHFAWIFLAGKFAYKLKKPVRFADFDLTTLQARRANCELEIALNRRLAATTYIGVVPLGRRSRLEVECDRQPVEWLVKMRRLPEELTLERLLPTIAERDPRLDGLLAVLCGFYGRSPRAAWDTAAYVQSLDRQSSRYCDQLLIGEIEDEHTRVREIGRRHRAFTSEHRELLGSRLQRGRVCDAHGDLRPEHVFLTDDPQIIDCLEFSAELRQLDSAEEMSFLGLECARLGRPDIAARLIELYQSRCDDDIPPALLDYYRSRRALVRAFLCAWHLEDGIAEPTARRWLDKARWYIGQAEAAIDHALG